MSQYLNNNDKNAIQDKCFTPLRGVKLAGGLFKRTFENNIEYLKTLDADAMLYHFREKAGKPAPGKPYTGHFEDNIKGQTAGLYLMGAGNTLRWTEDAELREGLAFLVDEIEACAEADGYLMAVPKEEFGTKEYPNYVRIWLTYGLTAAHFAGNEKAFPMLRKWQDWFNQCDDLPIIKYLCLAFQGVVASTYLYNTPIGKREDVDVTIQYYEEDWRLAQFIHNEAGAAGTRRQHGVEPHVHGTEIEAMEGYLDLYRATGKHYYLRAVQNFYAAYQKDYQNPGGGISLCEYQNGAPGLYLLSNEQGYNELCCSSFWLLLNQRLHRLFPETESYAAEMEASIYNVGIANQDGEKDICYFAHLDKSKIYRFNNVTCCCGVGTKMYASLPEYIYSVSDSALYVDLYAANEFVWEREAGNVTVALETDMPFGDEVKITLDCAPQEFTLTLRVPRWADGAVDIFVNGEKAARGAAGSYVGVSRRWRAGDAVRFRLPFAWKISRYRGTEQADGHDRFAFEYGPLLMAFRGKLNENGYLEIGRNPSDLRKRLKRGDYTHFEIEGAEGVALVPYLEIKPETEFTVYPLFDLQ